MHDDVGAPEGLLERIRLADVALPVLHLRPAALGRVEGTAGDADDPVDPVVVLEQRDQAGAERARGAGDRDGEVSSGAASSGWSVPAAHHRARPRPAAAGRGSRRPPRFSPPRGGGAALFSPALPVVFRRPVGFVRGRGRARRRRLAGASPERPSAGLVAFAARRAALAGCGASASPRGAGDCAARRGPCRMPPRTDEHVDVGVAVEVGVDPEGHRVEVGEDPDRAARAAGDRHVGRGGDHPLARARRAGSAGPGTFVVTAWHQIWPACSAAAPPSRAASAPRSRPAR